VRVTLALSSGGRFLPSQTSESVARNTILNDERHDTLNQHSNPKLASDRCIPAAIIFCAALLSPSAATAQTIFAVTNTNDLSAGSLKQVIIDANTTPNADANTPDVIMFDIGAGGVQTVVTSLLPAISDPVVIDGTTQPGYNDVPIVIVNGSNTAIAFSVTGGGTTIRGLVIEDFSCGMRMDYFGGKLIEENYVGTDVTGTFDHAGTGQGVSMRFGSHGTTVRNNLVSGIAEGIRVQTIGNMIEDNFVGTNVWGTHAVPNTTGMRSFQDVAGIPVTFNTVARNLVSANQSIDIIYRSQRGRRKFVLRESRWDGRHRIAGPGQHTCCRISDYPGSGYRL
jgi:hypothetical protein